MTGHGRAPERTTNGANQSANGGSSVPATGRAPAPPPPACAGHPRTVRVGEVATRPHLRGKGGRAAVGEPDRAVQVTAGGNSGPHVWRGGLATAVIITTW